MFREKIQKKNNEAIQHNNKSITIHPSKLVYEYKWVNKDRHEKTMVSYSFHQRVSTKLLEYRSDDQIFMLNNMQIKQTKISMKNISDVANINFFEFLDATPVNIPIISHNFINNSVYGYAYMPNLNGYSPMLIRANSDDNNMPTAFNYGGQVFMHELLHTVGLTHTHDSIGLTQRESIMSYHHEYYSGAYFDGHYSSTPMLYDITALQYLYGANMSSRTGDTIYGFYSNSEREHFTARNSSDKLIFCVWDAGGNDTFNFSRYQQNQLINLNQGNFSNVGGLKGNVSIAWGVTIENAFGGHGNDILIGNEVSNRLSGGHGADKVYGGEGADQLNGGAGADIFCYRNIADSYITSSDTIYDFKSDEDKLDFSGLISSTNGIEFVNKFSTSSRIQMRQNYDDIANLTYLLIDFRGQGDDFNMKINFTGKHQFTANDFIFGTSLVA